MAIPDPKARPAAARVMLLLIAGLVLAWLAAERFWVRPGVVVASDPVVVVPPPVVAAAPAPAGVAAPQVLSGGRAVEAPRFDIVRVGPKGDSVIAGQAAPGSDVVVRSGGTEVAHARADAHGAFVALPSEPISPGGHELTLASRERGGAEVKGEGSVVLVVPAAPVASAAASVPPVVALLVPDAAAPRILQEPAPVPAPADTKAAPAVVPVTLDRVDYDDAGAIRFTGGAAAGATVRVYVDNSAVGDQQADTGGRWALTPAGAVVPGLHSVRVDALDGGGLVVSRVELPFQRAALPATDTGLAGGRVVVQPGQNLWRLARSAYGRGVQYTVIYLANRGQIRDPKLIYPGQAFSVPAAAH